MDNDAGVLEVNSDTERGSADYVEMPSIVRPMELTVDKVAFIVDKIDGSDWALDDSMRNLPREVKMRMFIEYTSLVLEIGDFWGVVFLTSLEIGWRAEISIILWDRRAMRRIEDGKALLRWIMWAFKLNRLAAFLSTTNTLALRFDKKLGFKEEGRLRHTIRRNGRSEDTIVLGLIREEVGLA